MSLIQPKILKSGSQQITPLLLLYFKLLLIFEFYVLFYKSLISLVQFEAPFLKNPGGTFAETRKVTRGCVTHRDGSQPRREALSQTLCSSRLSPEQRHPSALIICIPYEAQGKSERLPSFQRQILSKWMGLGPSVTITHRPKLGRPALYTQAVALAELFF